MGTSSTVQKILTIDVQYDKAILELGQYKQELIDIKQKEKDLKAAYDSGAVSLAEYGRRQSALEQQTKALRNGYNDLTRALQNQIKQENFAKGSLAGLRAELSKLTQEYDHMSRATRQGGAGLELARKINKITDEIKNAEKATQRFYRNVGNYKSALHGINGLTAGFKNAFSVLQSLLGGLGAVTFGRQLIQVARDFEDGMARVRAVSNPLEGEFMALRDKAMELGRDTRYTATQVAEAMEELARKGFSAEETLNTITPTLQLAQANTISMADAAQIASSTMRAFGMESSNMTHIADVLSSTCAHSATNMSLLGEAMKNAGPIMATLKSDMRGANEVLHETVALIGGMANVGMTGSDAGTGVKQIVLDLASASRKSKKKSILEHYGIQLDEARLRAEGLIPVLKEMKEAGLANSSADLQQLFTRYSAARAANLIKNIDQVAELQRVTSVAYGENERMFNQSLGNLSGAIYRMQSAWQDFMIRVMDSSEGFVTGPIELITGGIKSLGHQINAVGQLVLSIFSAKMLMPALSKIAQLAKNYYFQSQEAQQASLAQKQAAYDAELVKYRALILKKQQLDETLYNREVIIEQQKRALDDLRMQKEGIVTLELINQSRLRVATDISEIEMRTTAMNEYAAQRMRLEAEITDQEKILEGQVAVQHRITRQQMLVNDKIVAKQQIIVQGQVATQTTMWARFGGVMKRVGSAVTGVLGTMVKGLWSLAKAFAPLLIVTGFMEIIGAIVNARREAAAFEKKLDDIEKLRNGELIQTNSTIIKLQQIQEKLAGINDGHKKTAEELSTEETLIDTLNGLLGKQYEKYEDIKGELPKIIAQLKEQAKVQAAQNILAEEYAKIMRIAQDRGIEFKSLEDMVKALNQLQIDRGNKWQASVTGFLDKLGIAPVVSAAVGSIINEIPSFLDLTARRLFNLKNLEADIEAVYDAAKIDENILKSGILTNEQYFQAIGMATDKANPDASSTLDGDYNPFEGLGNGKKGKKAVTDYAKTLGNLYNTWQKKLLDLQTENVVNPFEKARKQLITELAKLQLDAAKALDLESNSRLAEAAKKYPKQWREIVLTVGQTVDEERKKIYLELSKLVLDQNEKLLDREIAFYDLRNSVIAAKLAERNDMEGREYANELALLMDNGEDVLSATKTIYDKRAKLMREQFSMEDVIAKKNFEKDKNNLLKSFVNQELGTGTTKYTGSKEDMMLGVDEYIEQRESLDTRLANNDVDKEQYDRELTTLNQEYAAEADYYARLNLMEEKYALDSQERARQNSRTLLELKKKMYDESLKIVQQGIANQFNAQLLGYEKETALAGQHGYNLATMDEQQWQSLQQRIGARDAIELQNEWAQYQAELTDFNQHGADMYASQEEYEARRIELARKGADIQTKANESIQASDEARYEAASKITGGIKDLVEAMGEDNKDAVKLAKVLALAQIAISTGEAISKMVSAEAGKGVLGIATTAAGVAEILANIASAIATVKSAKFARGVVGLEGPGTSMSDSIPAQLSKGESVVNARATEMFAPLLMAMNAIGNGVYLPRNSYTVQPDQMAELRDSMIEANREIRPVVDVQEITRTQRRVEVIQNLDSF